MTRPLTVLLALYLLLALAFGAINPLFEVPDEQVHFFTALFIAEEGRLPAVPQPPYAMPFVPTRPAEWLGQEAAQPPLYYLLSSLVLRLFDTAGVRDTIVYNPFVRLGDAGAPANRNAFVHGPWEAFPWRGYAAAAHALRALSALMGLGTLWLIDRTARSLWPERGLRRLLAVALAAFLPQYIFLHSSITNDALIILLATAVLAELAALELAPGRAAGLQNGRYLRLGLLVGLAALTKNQGVLLLAFTAGVVVLRGLGRRRPVDIGRRLALIVLPVLLLAGWLWWRNWQLYGDPTAANQFVAIAGGDRGYTLWQVLGELNGFWVSLFALFGWFNVRAPEAAYWGWGLLVGAAVLGGLAAAPWRGGGRGWARLTAPAVLLAGWVLLVLAALVSFAMRTPAMQGRLLLPAVLPLALGMAFGLAHWVPVLRRLGLRPLLAPVVLLAAPGFLTAVYALAVTIPGAYAPPERLESLAGRPPAFPLELPLGEHARLRGYDLSAASVERGGRLTVTLYWESIGATAENRFVALQLVTAAGERLAGVDTFSGRGLYPTGLWRPGELVVDPVVVEIPTGHPAAGDGCGPLGLGLDVGLMAADGGAGVRIGRLRLAPDPVAVDCARGSEAGDLLGSAFRLNQVDLPRRAGRPGETLPLRLTWEALAPPAADVTVFLQLLDENGEIAAQFDAPPGGDLLPTSLWAAGDVVVDERQIVLPADRPAGRYRLIAGLYRADGSRLPAVDRAGRPHPDDAILLAEIELR